MPRKRSGGFRDKGQNDKSWRKKDKVDRTGIAIKGALAGVKKFRIPAEKRIDSMLQVTKIMGDINFWDRPRDVQISILTNMMNFAASQDILHVLSNLREEIAKKR